MYAILHAPRGDATEAIVLVGAWRNIDGELNRSGVALVLTLARYFNRWSLWSKDIIFLITADSKAGPQAWVDAYHDTHESPAIDSLPVKSGALQGAVVIDYPFDHRFESIHIVYDGINGQLPNLDLFNTVVSIASGQMGIRVSLQKMWQHSDSYQDRLKTMLRGMINQGLGHASGPHSSFIPYHVDAITLQPFGNGWQDEMAMGRVIESTFRSLNNLLEHLHQSFFFYLLMQANRFVSIGTYLPSAMLVATNFTIMAIFLWVKSGWPSPTKTESVLSTEKGEEKEKAPLVIVEASGSKALIPQKDLQTRERKLALPLAVVAGCQFLGLVPLYIFNHTSKAVSLSPNTIRKRQSMLTNDPESPRSLLHLPNPQHFPPSSPLHPPPLTLLHNTYSSPTSPHPVLLSPSPRHVPLLPRYPQFLPLNSHRYPIFPLIIHSSIGSQTHYRRYTCCPIRCSCAFDCTVCWCEILGFGCGRCFGGSSVRMGCWRHDDTGCSLVCLVARVGRGWDVALGKAQSGGRDGEFESDCEWGRRKSGSSEWGGKEIR